MNPAKIEDVALEIRSLTENRGADVVIEASGSVAALQSAIRTVGFQGRVIVVSFLAGKADALYLGDEFHHNRIRLISSQASGVNPGLYPRWTPERKFKAALAMLPSLKLDHLISHEFTFEQAAEAYRLCDESPDQTMQVIFRV
ncbi:MAG: zinc-binding alcohol dehydrogenase [Lentisphaeria bacterium]|nr:MAG: zinc-binding alcohol dehydrogenase [Lentisphaeria bacterium]